MCQRIMKQILLKNAEITVEEVPAPIVEDGKVLVQVAYSCLSSGTEISTVNSSRRSLLQTTLKEPKKIQEAFKFAKTHGGISNTVARVKDKLGAAKSLGYSCAGVVVDVGRNLNKDTRIGDRVASAGTGHANHAEIACIPRNLAARVPDNLDLKEAPSVTVGAIAMQGLR